MAKGGGKSWCFNLWWWWVSSRRCRYEEVADEIEEQGDIFRYLVAVFLIMTLFLPLYECSFLRIDPSNLSLHWDCMNHSSHEQRPKCCSDAIFFFGLTSIINTLLVILVLCYAFSSVFNLLSAHSVQIWHTQSGVEQEHSHLGSSVIVWKLLELLLLKLWVLPLRDFTVWN